MSPPTGPRLSGFKRGLLRMRSPEPVGIIHLCSPVFMSIAVMREYGGLNSGRPSGTCGLRPVVCMYSRLLSSFGSGGLSLLTANALRDGIYIMPVAGSTAAPDQFAPPV